MKAFVSFSSVSHNASCIINLNYKLQAIFTGSAIPFLLFVEHSRTTHNGGKKASTALLRDMREMGESGKIQLCAYYITSTLETKFNSQSIDNQSRISIQCQGIMKKAEKVNVCEQNISNENSDELCLIARLQ